MNEVIVKKTQSTLGKIIKKPPLNEKQLSRPPFRFLHDIFTSVIKSTGFMKGLFPAEDMVSDNVKDRDAKLAFLQKAIDFVGMVTGTKMSARPSKIVAGQEPEKTNEFLQALAEAVNKQGDNEEYLRQFQEGGGGGETKQEKKPSSEKERERKGESSDDRRKGSGREDSRAKSGDSRSRRSEDKSHRDKDRDRDKERDKDRDREKHRDRDRERDKDRDKDREKDRDREKHREKDRDREKSREGQRGEASEERHRSSSDRKHRDERDDDRREKREQRERRSERREKEEKPTEVSQQQQDGEDQEEAPIPKIPRPSSAKGARRPHRDGCLSYVKDVEAQSHRTPHAQSTTGGDGMDGDEALPPQVVEARRLARPSSARPPPRAKKQELRGPEQERVDSGKRVTNVITDEDRHSDDEDTFLVEENAAEPLILEREGDGKITEDDSAEHGGLVRKILETKKEFESQKKADTKKDSSVGSDATRRKEREMVQREVESLRASIQTLTRSANPLGKVMDYVQEDLEAMGKEAEGWRKENRELAQGLRKEHRETEESIEPLKLQLAEIDNIIEDRLNQIAAVKHNVIRNDEKIQRMIASVART